MQGAPRGGEGNGSLTAFEDASFRGAARAVQARREEEGGGGDWGVLARNLQVINQAVPFSPPASTDAPPKRSPFLDRDVADSVDVRPL